jgi:outer membrane protein assembly factor BamB
MRLMMRRYLYCTFLAAVSTVTGMTAQAENWTQWRGAERANRSTETGLFSNWGEDGPPLAWTAEGLGSGYASVSVIGRRIFTTGNVGNTQSVVALDSSTGKVVWTSPISDTAPKHGYDGSRSTPTIDGDKLYVVSSDGAIICMSGRDGKVVWRRDFDEFKGKMMSGWGFSESPLIDGDRVICTPGGNSAVVVALNKATGENIWACSLESSSQGQGLNEGAGYASPIISEGGGVRQYVQLVGKGLIGVRARDGKLLWQYTRVANTTANIPTALVEGDYVFTSTGYNTGSALLKLVSSGQGEVKAEEVYWLESKDLQNKHGGMTLVDGHIYCGHGNGDGKPICVELMTGDVAWGPERADGRGETSTIYADGHIIYRREDGVVILAKATPEKFEVVRTFKPSFQQGASWAHPVIANGVLYLREQDKLMAYKIGS